MAFARFVPLCRVRLLFAAFRGGGDNRAEKKKRHQFPLAANIPGVADLNP